MQSFFRRVSKSSVGTVIAAGFLIAILASFALGGISNFGIGSGGGSLGSSTLASVGGEAITDREMSDAMQKHLQDVRQQNPNADYAAIVADFEPILNQLIDQKALVAFSSKFGFPISKRLVDADIAQIPGVRGLNGQVTVQSYQTFLSRARLTDAEVREILQAQVAARNLILPLVTPARVPLGVARQYAGMLLERRQGAAALLPLTLFTAGLKPTDADLQRFYQAHRNSYVVPEQRVIRMALITPEKVPGVAVSDQEVAAYYNANQATYSSKETRSLSQVVVPDQKTAQAIADRVKGGATLAAAAAPAGTNAAVSNPADQSRDAYASAAGAKAADAVFAAAPGAVVGPVQSDFGWVVAKVQSVKKPTGKTLAQARPEIVTKLTEAKRKTAMSALVDKAQNALDGGANFSEVANQLKLAVTTTPPITAQGTSLEQPGFNLGPNLAPAVKAAFDIAPTDEPEIATLPNDGGFAIVSPAEVKASAPAPLASIRDRVAADWVRTQAEAKARAVAEQIAARASAGLSLADAVKQSGVNAPVQPIAAQRIQVAGSKEPVPPAIRVLFNLVAGKSRAVADSQGRGFFVVKVDKIVPGDILTQPGLIQQMSGELQQATEDDYARQFIAAARKELKVRRNDGAIAAMKQRLLTQGS